MLRSKFEFSFVASVHFLQKKWGEVDRISRKFILCDHVCNSHDHSVLQSIYITRRNLMLITLRASRVKENKSAGQYCLSVIIQRNHSDTFILLTHYHGLIHELCKIKACLQWAVGCLIYRYLFKEMICQGLLKKPGSDHVIFSMIHSFACMYMYVYIYTVLIGLSIVHIRLPCSRS